MRYMETKTQNDKTLTFDLVILAQKNMTSFEYMANFFLGKKTSLIFATWNF